MKSMALESQDLLWNVSLSSCLQDDHRMGSLSASVFSSLQWVATIPLYGAHRGVRKIAPCCSKPLLK